MTAVTDFAALLVTAAGLACAAVVFAVTRRPAPALAVLLDLLTAAGLLRLAGEPSWGRILTAAAIVALRRLLTTGLRAGHVPLGPPGPPPRRLPPPPHGDRPAR